MYYSNAYCTILNIFHSKSSSPGGPFWVYIIRHDHRLPLILLTEYLCKITTSNYIACLKTILKNNQTSGRGDPALLEKPKRKHGHGQSWICLFLLCLHLATFCVTIQHNVFSNTVLSFSRYEVQCFKLNL